MNRHPLLSELRDAVFGAGDVAAVQAHIESCLGCRVRMARIRQHGGVVSAAPNVVQAVVDASAVVPGVQALVSASADTEPEAGELWRVGDEDEALLVWVRRNFGDGAVDVVPVVLDADFADEYSVLVDPADSPLTVDLALLVSLRVHVHRAAFLDRIGSLDVSGRVEDVAAAIRAGAPVAGSSVAAIVSDDDERIEYRQALRDLLADWSPSAWLSREHPSSPQSSPGGGEASVDGQAEIERMQHEVAARVESAWCLPVASDRFVFADGLVLTALFMVDFLDTAVFVGSVGSLTAALAVQDALLASCERATALHPDADAVCIVEVRDEWPCVLYSRASMRPAYELPAGRWSEPRPILEGFGLLDTLWKHLDGAVNVWDATERAARGSGPAAITDLASGHARAAIDRVRQQGRRALQPAKKVAWSGLPDDLHTRVGLFVAAVADEVPLDDALARLHDDGAS